jgi:hypothetical protein
MMLSSTLCGLLVDRSMHNVAACLFTQLLTKLTFLFTVFYRIHHIDLYRLSNDPSSFRPLNLDHVFSQCVSLIEWPSRLGQYTPNNRLDVVITLEREQLNDEEDVPRRVVLQPHGHEWKARINALLDEGYLDDLLL